MTAARQLMTCVSLAATIAALPATAVAAPLAAPFASVDVSCAAGSAQAPPLTSAHPVAVARISTTSATAIWDTNASTSGNITAGDQLFSPWVPGSLNTNDSPTGSLQFCSAGGAAHIDFYDVSTAPTNYPQSVQDPTSSEEYLPFNVSSAARFVADIQLTQGAIESQWHTRSWRRRARWRSGSSDAEADRSPSMRSMALPPGNRCVRPLPVAVSYCRCRPRCAQDPPKH